MTEPLPPAVCAYDAVVICGGMGAVSGQFPLRGGPLTHCGRLGAELDLAAGRAACRVAALIVLAQIHAATDGFAALEGLLCVDGYLACTEGFADHPAALDAASELHMKALGERGRHARAAAVVPRLPLDAPVELCVLFASVLGHGPH